MSLYHALVLFPLFVMLTWAAVHDVRTRRIPNVLNLILFLTGWGVSLAGLWKVNGMQAGQGVLAGFALTLPLFMLGAVGGGDVKIMTALGPWVGPWGVLYVFLARAVIALPIVITQAAQEGRLRALFRNSALLTMGAAHVEQTGFGHIVEMGQNSSRIGARGYVPWAVPVLFATAWVVWLMG